MSSLTGGFAPGLDTSSSGTSPMKHASVKVSWLPHAFANFLFIRFAMIDALFAPVSLILTIVRVPPSTLPTIQTLPPRSSFTVAGLLSIAVSPLGEYWDGSLSPEISSLIGDFSSSGLDGSSSGTSPVKQASVNVFRLPHAFANFLLFRFAMMEAFVAPVNRILTIVRIPPSTLPTIQTLPPRSSFSVAGLPLIVVPPRGENWDGSLSAIISSLMGGFSSDRDTSSSGTSPAKQASANVS
mmetsp:Transcript_42925/g.85008  ORF Transcript_42925/g.85008 Transcript_42925/m.85008 type:complete len:240 (+) Transcript_42925:2051-2770(+)